MMPVGSGRDMSRKPKRRPARGDAGTSAAGSPSRGPRVLPEAQIRRALMLASQHHQAGRLDQARALYAQILADRPDDPETLHLAGLLAHQSGAPGAAARMIEQAIAARPDQAPYHHNLGEVLFTLGRYGDAAASYRRALAIAPDATDAHFSLGAALYEVGAIEDALASYARAADLSPGDPEIPHDLGNAYVKLGRFDEAEGAFRRALALAPDFAEARARLECLAYYREHLQGAEFVPDRYALLQFALTRAPDEGLILEFGVAAGDSLGFLAGLVDQDVYGFDSFEGLPEDWRAGFAKGAFAEVERPDDLPANAKLVVGWFEETLPGFLGEQHQTARLIHVDCDLYSSAKTVFAVLEDRIADGTVIVFDEYLNFPEWREHEHKAFMEFIEATGKSFRYIGTADLLTQVAVQISDGREASERHRAAPGRARR